MLVLKAQRNPNLVPKIVTVSRGGKTFHQTVYVDSAKGLKQPSAEAANEANKQRAAEESKLDADNLTPEDDVRLSTLMVTYIEGIKADPGMAKKAEKKLIDILGGKASEFARRFGNPHKDYHKVLGEWQLSAGLKSKTKRKIDIRQAPPKQKDYDNEVDPVGAWADDSREYLQKVYEHNREKAGENRAIKLESSSANENVFFYINPSSREPGRWQLTRISVQDGMPFGHMTFDTKDLALESASGVWGKYGPPDGNGSYRVTDVRKSFDIPLVLRKARKLHYRTDYQGLPISIENRKGSYRRGTDSDGHEWENRMDFAYGYIRLTEGTDGDHLDCYIGPNKDSRRLFIVHQVDPNTKQFDEDKVMLGFDTAEAAKTAYLAQYDNPGFFGTMEVTDIEKFKAMIEKRKGKKLVVKAIRKRAS